MDGHNNVLEIDDWQAWTVGTANRTSTENKPVVTDGQEEIGYIRAFCDQWLWVMPEATSPDDRAYRRI